MMPRMYFASRSPRSSKTSSWSASNSFPIASICSSLSRLSGLSTSSSISISIAFGVIRRPLQFDFDVALGGVYAGADHLSLGARHLSVLQVPDLAGAQLADARMADALAAAVREREADVLAGHQDRHRAIRLGLLLALEELDLAALALLRLAEHGLEALHVEALAVTVLVEMRLHRLEQLSRTAEERLALAPVGAQLVEVGRLQTPHLAG